MASHTGFSVGRSVVNCADDGLEVGETDGLGVGDEDETMGYCVGLRYGDVDVVVDGY